MNDTKIYEFDPLHPGTPKEKIAETPASSNVQLNFKVGDKNIVSLREAAQSTSQFPVLLQSGLQTILFDSYNQTPTTFGDWCDIVSSNKPAETYLANAAIGTLPLVRQNQPYPEIDIDLADVVSVSNEKYGGILSITEELIRQYKQATYC